MNYLKVSAIIDHRRRLELTRVWDYELSCISFIGLNPSTANNISDDATIRRCVSFAKREGYGSIRMYNLFSAISTDPKQLMKILKDNPDLLEENNQFLYNTVCNFTPVICCWGSLSKDLLFIQQSKLIKESIVNPLCFGTNKDGNPKHPLYLSLTTPLIPFK